jgi:hypothetical protein
MGETFSFTDSREQIGILKFSVYNIIFRIVRGSEESSFPNDLLGVMCEQIRSP